MKSMQKNMLFLVLIFVFFSSCTTTKIIVPPMITSPTNTYFAGQFVWYDLVTTDIAGVKKFYGELFGWEFEGEDRADAPYTVIKNNGTPIGGIVYSENAKRIKGSRWLSYLSVNDVDSAVNLAKQNGAVVHREPFEFENRGRTAVIADPQGALVVLIRSYVGDPAASEPPFNTWLWTELFTRDLKAAASFYEKLVGYRAEEYESGVDVPYYVFRKNDRAKAGMVGIPWENVKPNWLPYVRVEDPASLAKKVESLGGMLILAPGDDIRKGSVAIIADPSGAAIAIQKWPFQDAEGQ
jgi:predicted enzyme related to lactoylglutathione lyase